MDQVRALAGPQALAAAGCGGTIDHYKKVPAGFDPDHPRAEFLRYKGLHAGISLIAPPELTHPDLVDLCMERFERFAPLHRWLVQVLA